MCILLVYIVKLHYNARCKKKHRKKKNICLQYKLITKPIYYKHSNKSDLKQFASTLLQISVLQGHLQGEQIILMNITKFIKQFDSKSADWLHVI